LLGNDIVDIAKTHHYDSAYYQRFNRFAFGKESEQIVSALVSNKRMSWVLWSIKEAVYKTSVKHGNREGFNPRGIAIEHIVEKEEDRWIGGAILDDSHYQTVTTANNKYIHTVCTTDTLSYVDQVVKLIRSDTVYQSSEVRVSLIQSIAARKNWREKDISIKKNHLGIPKIYYKNSDTAIDVSLSHHGFYCAYCYSG
jgi:hypothetical protein